MKRAPILIGVLALAVVSAGFAIWSLVAENDEGTPVAPVATAPDPTKKVTPPKAHPAPEPLKPPTPPPIEDDPEAGGTSVVGTVLSPAGNPVSDALVTLLRKRDTNVLSTAPSKRAKQPITTDKSGRFRFDRIEGGKGYALRVEHGAYSTADVPGIELPADVETKLGDIVLKSGGEIHGVVTKPDGKPLAKAEIRILSAGGSEQPLLERTPVKVVLTDENGLYKTENLTPGTYDVLATAGNYKNGQRLGVHLADSGGTAKVDFVMQEGTTIIGKVVDGAKEPIDGATVEVRDQNSGSFLVATVLSGGDGVFTAGGLGTGKYRLEAKKEGYSPTKLNDVVGGAKGVMIGLRQNFGITGFVVDADGGAPVKSFGLLLYRLGKHDVLNDPVGDMEEFQRTSDGSFTLEDVRPGKYKIQAFANGFAPSWSDAIEIKREHVHDVKIKVAKGGVLVGTVVDGAGKALAGATVRLLDNTYIEGPIVGLLLGGPMSQFGSMQTDEKGGFRFPTVEPGTYQVQATFPEHTMAAVKDLKVENGKETRCGPIALTEGGTVAGTIVDDSGRPVPHARVMLIADNGTTFDTKADNDGAYAFRHMLPGVYQISPQAPATTARANDVFQMIVTTARSKQAITIVEGQVLKLDLPLRMG